MPPKSPAADVVPINIRLPRHLHKRLEEEAKKPGNSITAEVIARVEQSFDWPTPEQFAQVLLAIRGRPEMLKQKNVEAFLKDVEEIVFQKAMMDDLKRK